MNIRKSISNFFSKSASETLQPSTYRSEQLQNQKWFWDNTGTEILFSYNGLNDVKQAYEKCPVVYSIINKQAYAYINGKTWVVNSRGKEATGDFSNKLRKLFARPNPLQNQKQFEAQIAIYMRLFGYCVILPFVPKGYDLVDATSLWIIPPYMCEFVMSRQTFYNLGAGQILKVKVKYGDEESELNHEDIIILKDISPGFSNIIIPDSPIKPLQQNINNLIAIYESKGALINNRGALGILTPEKEPDGNIPLEPEEKEDIQNGLMRYGLKSGQWKFIVTNTSLKWQQMSVPYRDLMLTEWAQDDSMVICDALNYPYRLLSTEKGASYNDINEFKKLLYQDFVKPFGEMICDQLNEIFKCGENNCKIVRDYSDVDVLQEDDVKKANARKLRNEYLQIEFQNGLITLDDWLADLGRDPLPNGLGQARATDPKNSNIPLASIIGVGGVQGLVEILGNQTMNEDSKRNTIRILFGISPEDAASMVGNQIPQQ